MAHILECLNRRDRYMIGDWVFFKGKPCKWESAHYNLSLKGMLMVQDIPLTCEILKSNGFERCTLQYDDHNVIFYNPETKHLCIYSLILGAQKPKVAIYIHYIHELQLALRSVGLYRLAEEFKYEN